MKTFTHLWDSVSSSVCSGLESALSELSTAWVTKNSASLNIIEKYIVLKKVTAKIVLTKTPLTISMLSKYILHGTGLRTGKNLCSSSNTRKKYIINPKMPT